MDEVAPSNDVKANVRATDRLGLESRNDLASPKMWSAKKRSNELFLEPIAGPSRISQIQEVNSDMPVLPDDKGRPGAEVMEVDDMGGVLAKGDQDVDVTGRDISARRVSGADYYAAPGVFAKDFASSEATSEQQGDPQNPPPPNDGRQLNVTDALSYLDAVKYQFHDRPDVYNRFLDIMKDFKSQSIDTPGVIDRVSNLFAGHPELIQGFNTFLPVGYRIECTVDAHDTNCITVTTPEGTTTQSTTAVHQPLPPPFSATGSTSEVNPYTHEQITPAMDYVTKIKQRFADHPEQYKEFLDILEAHKRPPVDEAHLANRIAKLFQYSPDLLSDFQVFMPHGVVPNADVLGALNETSASEKPHKAVKAPNKRGTKGGDVASVGGSSAPQKRKRKPAEREKEKEAEKEKDVRASQNKAKKQKYPPLAVAPDPPYAPYGPPSPPVQQYPLQGPSTAVQTIPATFDPPPPPPQALTSQDETLFFDRVRRALDNRETYNEFLKLINLFTQDIIDMRRLVEKAYDFFGEGELMAQFKDILGWDSAWELSHKGSATGVNGYSGLSDTMDRPSKADLRLRCGPSYRKLPASEVDVPCSGRDDMCRSVLNDEWVSHPTWTSEDSGFVAHRKNIYEEALHRSEEERHEYDFHIEAITRTLTMLEPINAKIMQLAPEERPGGKFKINLTGASKAIHHRIIKKVYGREAGLEVLQAILDCPGLAIPIVLARLKQKEEEWKRAQRAWNNVWREVDARNYQKSLDHQGVSFKTNDKKATTAKTFLNQIEAAREEQMSRRAALIDPLLARTRPRYQLAFVMDDTSVLQDLVKLTLSFLDRMHHHYSFAERRRMEGFLRMFIPMFFMLDPSAFNAAFRVRNAQDADFGAFDDFSPFIADEEGEPSTSGAPRNGRSGRRNGGGNDLRKKLLKSSAGSRKARGKSSSRPSSRLASPVPVDGMSIDENSEGQREASETTGHPMPTAESSKGQALSLQKHSRRGSFFANSSIYTLLRIIEIIYSRLLSCKSLAAKLASDPASPFTANPVARELSLLDTQPPDPGLVKMQQRPNPASHFYGYLLESCERLFDNEIDQQMFEDICRHMYGTKAYVMFTIDKILGSLLKQVQSILSDKSIRLFDGLKRERDLDTPAIQHQTDLRMNAEKIIGPDENLFRIDWAPETMSMTIQLIGKDDSNFDDFDVVTGRWQAYIDSFVADETSKGLPGSNVKPPFLSRNLRNAMKTPLSNELHARSGLEIRVCVRTYRLFFVSDTEDVLIRHWDSEEIIETDRRARKRVEKNRRWLEKFDLENSKEREPAAGTD